jgi:hypothetical protein
MAFEYEITVIVNEPMDDTMTKCFQDVLQKVLAHKVGEPYCYSRPFLAEIKQKLTDGEDIVQEYTIDFSEWNEE